MLTWFQLKGEDEMKAILMSLIHDIGEITAGDITPSDGVAPGSVDTYSHRIHY